MSRQVQLRRGTTAQNATFTGLQGELIVDTDLKKLILHDNVTLGGIPLASEAYVLANAATTGNVTFTNNVITATNTNADLHIAPNGTGFIHIDNRLRVNGITIGHGNNGIQTNTVVGELAMGINISGNQVSAFGNSAMASNTIGSNCGAFGDDALISNINGNHNYAFGSNALGNVTSGSRNIGIGSNTATASPLDNDTIVIGTNVVGLGSGSTVIGTISTLTTRLFGNLQISSTPVISSTGNWIGAHIVTAVPAASIGQAGDVAGMLAVDAAFLYYCTAAYDGVTSIWSRQSVTGATW